MKKNVLKGHPINMLYVLVGNSLTNEVMDAIEEKLRNWSDSRVWTINAPELIDYIDEAPSSGEESHTFGFALRMYSAHPPWGDKLPREIDRQHLEEVEYILSAIEKMSRDFGCSFKLQLDQIAMGSVENGKMDERLRVGLVNEWRKVHGLTLV
ncbi:MAG: hypothetical protein FJ308_11885 [Planctomycetes bacterium]|nr:hypothetical protein [Planctomycetota bacterium]